MALVDLVQLVPHAQDLLCVDRDVGCLAEVASARLVDHDAGVREAEALARGAAAEEQGTHRGGLTYADGGYGTADVGHRVVDCEA